MRKKVPILENNNLNNLQNIFRFTQLWDNLPKSLIWTKRSSKSQPDNTVFKIQIKTLILVYYRQGQLSILLEELQIIMHAWNKPRKNLVKL